MLLAAIALVALPQVPQSPPATPAHVEAVIEYRHDVLTEWLEDINGPYRSPRVVRQHSEPHASPPAGNTGMGSDVEQWRDLVAAYFAPDDMGWAMRVMACESGGNPNATHPRSRAAGLFQFLPAWYEGRWGGEVWDPYDPTLNVQHAAALYYSGGPSHWVCK